LLDLLVDALADGRGATTYGDPPVVGAVAGLGGAGARLLSVFGRQPGFGRGARAWASAGTLQMLDRVDRQVSIEVRVELAVVV
jgi:hypothetical protein